MLMQRRLHIRTFNPLMFRLTVIGQLVRREAIFSVMMFQFQVDTSITIGLSISR